MKMSAKHIGQMTHLRRNRADGITGVVIVVGRGRFSRDQKREGRSRVSSCLKPSSKADGKQTSVAKATAYSAGFVPGINPRHTAKLEKFGDKSPAGRTRTLFGSLSRRRFADRLDSGPWGLPHSPCADRGSAEAAIIHSEERGAGWMRRGIAQCGGPDDEAI
jgi:hypothetical protein